MLSYEFKDVIFEFIQSNITVQQLEEWLVPRLPTLIKEQDSSDADVVATIELGLAEMSDGIRTEEDFRKLLFDAVCEHKMESALNATTSSSSTETPILMFPVVDVFATTTVVNQAQYGNI